MQENANPAIIFSNTCPASMLAKSLIPRLKGLDKKDRSSIGTSKNESDVGDPEGKNKLKKLTLCLRKPMNIEPKNTVHENKKVIKTWLVNAYPKGSIPNRLQDRMKVKSEKTKGK